MENFQTSSNTSHLNALTADKTMSHVITHAHGAPRATHEHAKQFDFSRYLVIGPENLPAKVVLSRLKTLCAQALKRALPVFKYAQKCCLRAI